jgi:hypothetical protein
MRKGLTGGSQGACALARPVKARQIGRIRLFDYTDLQKMSNKKNRPVNTSMHGLQGVSSASCAALKVAKGMSPIASE